MLNIYFLSLCVIFKYYCFLLYVAKNDYLSVVFSAIISLNALIIPMGIILLFDPFLLRIKKRFNVGNSHF